VVALSCIGALTQNLSPHNTTPTSEENDEPMPNRTVEDWPRVAAVAAPLSSAAWLAARGSLTKRQQWRWAAMPVLLWHQVEEWVWPGGFMEWLNRDVFGSSQEQVPLDSETAFVVNVRFGWTASLAASAFGDAVPALAIAVGLSNVGNSMLHLGWAARHRRWDPGAATAATLMLPWAVVGLRRRLGPGGAPVAHQVAGAIAGVVASAQLMRTLRGRLPRGADD